MFDPFGDFESCGYLRSGEKDLEIVKVLEHELFRANLPDAVLYLQKAKPITYKHFLQVHHILFSGVYPWAGQDRTATAPESAISKGESVWF